MSLQNRSSLDISFTVSAPGKVILFGEHSVVYDKSALASSLGLRTRLHFSEVGNSNLVSLDISAVALIFSCDLNVLRRTLKKFPSMNWNNPDAVMHEQVLSIVEDFVKDTSKSNYNAHQVLSLTCIFYLYFGILQSVDVRPFSIKIETDLTIGAGTGSSASFAVAVAGAFLHYLRLRSNSSDVTFSDYELDIISKWAFFVEKICHGKPSGIDNTVCTYGSIVEFRKSSGVQFFRTVELELLLINTKQSRSTKQLVYNVSILKNNHTSTVELILNAMDEIAKSALEYMLLINDCDQLIKTTEYYARLGELTNMNQSLLQALNVSHPKLDEICKILKHVGLDGKLTGAGGGGYAICIIPPQVKREIIQNIIEELALKGYEAILTKLGGAGVTIH